MAEVIFITLLLILFNRDAFSESLFVFYPIAERPNVVQGKLSDACPGIDITVFGRVGDFTSRVQGGPPDAILSKPIVIQQFPDYAIQLQGARGDKTEEPYVFLSVDKGIDPAGLADVTVGMIDILGRKEMTDFVGGFLSPTPKLKRVTKMEDLLPLLTFNMCGAILIGENSVGYFKSISQLNFVITPSGGMKNGMIAIAVKKGSNAEKILTAIKGLKSDVNTLLEVDSWK